MKGLSTVGRTGIEACGDHVSPSSLLGASRAGSLKQEKNWVTRPKKPRGLPRGASR